jgi:hypothetical protein
MALSGKAATLARFFLFLDALADSIWPRVSCPVDCHRAEAEQSLGLGRKAGGAGGAGDQVGVHTVLRRLALRYLEEHPVRARRGRVLKSDRGEFGRRPVINGLAEHARPEPRQAAASAQSNVTAYRLAIISLWSFRVRVRTRKPSGRAFSRVEADVFSLR